MIEKIGFFSKLIVLMLASVFAGVPEKKEIPVEPYEQRRIEYYDDKLTEDISNEEEIYTTVVEQADILVDTGSMATEPKDSNDDASKIALPEINKDDFSILAPTVNMSFEELVGDNLDRSLPSYMPEPGTYKLIVDLKYQVVMAYKKDEAGKYSIPVRYMLCSTGADATPSPTGTFKMRDYRVRYGLFVNTESYAQYWSLITGRIYFHSVLYLDTDASEYTETSYNNLGHNVSHGCIRLTVPDARWIWYNCAPGTEVTIREGSSKDKDTKDIREKLILAKLPDKRVDFNKIKLPYTDNWKIEDVPAEFKFINGSQ